ncbi:hypothetical protein E2C01_032819 [Portunus trituberculatus]|uniref:Uncharacterized protein n=1 Tax=Portunus trituberculatus TaxID=210409 RepID=A0A5B7F274_PORTR|nr:hypothetical protein [Portunus trituberculatus]
MLCVVLVHLCGFTGLKKISIPSEQRYHVVFCRVDVKTVASFSKRSTCDGEIASVGAERTRTFPAASIALHSAMVSAEEPVWCY